jgi:GT2 family glycosyltransferase
MKTNNSPWLSVVMPLYNGQDYLGAALQSINDQKANDIEIIAVDDGSTDATPDILKKWSTVLPLNVFMRQHTGNWVANTNYGLEKASGDYVCFLHQDDLWLPGRLDRLRQMTLLYPDINLFLHSSWFIDSNRRRVGPWTCPLPRKGAPLPPELILQRLLIQNFIAMPAPLFKRSAALKAGPMDEKLWFTADWKLWLALASQGPTIYLPEALAEYRIHSSSQTLAGAKNPYEIANQVRLVVEDVFPGVANHIVKASRTWQIAQVNIELYAILAAGSQGQSLRLSGFIVRFLLLGPVGWYVFFRDSRVVQRVFARWRAGLARRQHKGSP